MKTRSSLMLMVMLITTSLLLQMADAAPTANFASLFNGTNLNGWIRMNGGSFRAENRVIRLAGGQGWLRTEKAYGDFILTVEWRGLKTNYNSGIFIRAPLAGQPWAPDIWQINTKQTGIGELLAGPVKIIRSVTPAVPAGAWVSFRIEARGTNLMLWVDGRRAWDFHALKPASGYIGLQAEGKDFEFRNLQIVETNPGQLANSK